MGAVVFVQTKPTVTAELFQPAEFGAGEMLAITFGGVVAMLKVVCAVAEFPAASRTVPVMTWFAPSVLIVCACGQLKIGAVPTVQVNVTVTLELFQPFEFGAGEAAAVIIGAVLPMFRVIATVAVFPATSVTVPLTT